MYAPRFIKFGLLVLLLSFVIAAPVGATLININTAGVAELDTLEGIGPAYATRIVDYRTANGPFQQIDDIKQVKGIGESIFQKIKDSITVGDVESEESNETTLGADTSTLSSNSGSIPALKVITYFSPAPETSRTVDEELDIGAGSERLAMVDTPLLFRAETNLSYTKSTDFQWILGDGASAKGEEVTHAYAYPGEYIVVLRVRNTNEEAVSRTRVKILPASIEVVSASPRRIDLTNNTGEEVNLYGRALAVGGRVFVFPKDTLMAEGATISLASKVTGLTPQDKNHVLLLVVGEEGLNTLDLAERQEQTQEELARLYDETVVMVRDLALLSKPRPTAPQPTFVQSEQNINTPTPSTVVEIRESNQTETDKSNEMALAIEALPETEPGLVSGWWSLIKQFFLGR